LVAKLLQIGKICAILIHFGDLFHITWKSNRWRWYLQWVMFN
jgi:hypothetical protein